VGLTDWFRRRTPVTEATQVALPAPPTNIPPRRGYEPGIPRGGLTEWNSGMGASTQTDRRSQLQDLYESFLACPWSWAAVNAIARTITAGGLVTDWDADDGEGDQETPKKPANVLLLERMLAYCNPREDIRQLLRSTIVDLLVFGDAYIEVVWIGKQPVALFTLDSPTTTPITDEHGNVTGYVQITEYGQRADFDPHEVIHISLDSPRSGVFGVSPTQAALLPITAWLFAAATIKEIFRKGNPVTIHVDFPVGTPTTDINRWLAQYAALNIGPRNIGTPIVTIGDGKVTELQMGRVADYLNVLDQKRDEILASYGVPPAEAGVIEAGNLGGGTGESQRKMFLVNTCQPIAELVLEKFNFHLVRQGFGIDGWHTKFGEVDMRDSQTIEGIRDMRLRNGSWVLNKYRAVIGEPPVDGGDDAVLIDRQNLVLWRDLASKSQAGIAKDLKGSALEPGEPPEPGDPVQLEKPEPTPVPPVLAAFAGQNNNTTGDADQDGKDDEPPAESHRRVRRRLRESWSVYSARRLSALREMPDDDAAA
jgi:hypothetical protein